MDFNTSVPIYRQIADYVKGMIVSGRWAQGSQVPPVRELALEMGVNPNTVQKAVAFLEEEGLLHAERTSGRYVTTDEQIITQAKEEMTIGEIENFMSAMRGIGYEDEDTLTLFTQYCAAKGHVNGHSKGGKTNG